MTTVGTVVQLLEQGARQSDSQRGDGKRIMPFGAYRALPVGGIRTLAG